MNIIRLLTLIVLLLVLFTSCTKGCLSSISSSKPPVPEIILSDASKPSLTPLPYEDLIKKGKAAVLADEQLYFFNKALSLRPDSPEALVGRAGAYLKKIETDMDYYQGVNIQKWQSKALLDINKALTLNPNLSDGLYYRALCFTFEGKYDLAIADLSLALQHSPVNTEYLTIRAYVYMARKEFDKAIADCDEAIRADSKAAKPYIAKAKAYEALQNLQNALAEYDKAITASPDDSAPYINRALALENNKMIDEAIANYTKALRLKPDNLKAYKYRGALYKKKGKTDLAEADEKMYLELNPAAHFQRGMAFSSPDNAILAFTKAIELNPWVSDYYFFRGKMFLLKDEDEKALNDFNIALDISPDEPFVYKYRGKLLGEKGEAEAAMSDLKKECDLGVCDDYKLALRSTSTLRGRVIDRKTRAPVSDALVILKRSSHIRTWNANINPELIGRQYGITDKDGKFIIPPIAPDKPILPQLGGKEILNYIEAVYHMEFCGPGSGVSLENPENVIIEVGPCSYVSDGHFEEMFTRSGKILVRPEDNKSIANMLRKWEQKIHNKQLLQEKIREFDSK